MSGANRAVLDARRDFDKLGPATRQAIRTGDKALKDEIAALERKLAAPSVNGLERRYFEKELRETRAALDTLWSQPYPEPYVPGQRESGSAGTEDTMPG